MGARVFYYLFFFLLVLPLSSGNNDTETSSTSEGLDNAIKSLGLTSVSHSQKDITTPITTVPTVTPTTTPTLNPNSDPDTLSPATITPMVTPTPMSPGASWCVGSQSASPASLQVALDFACGYGGADCVSIQEGGSCYNPNTLHDHASYAFNSYYQKNPIPSSCNFGGTAVTTSTNPSTGTCQYPSTSTSSSILNTTNSNGATVFGAVPSTPSIPSPAAKTDAFPRLEFMDHNAPGDNPQRITEEEPEERSFRFICDGCPSSRALEDVPNMGLNPTSSDEGGIVEEELEEEPNLILKLQILLKPFGVCQALIYEAQNQPFEGAILANKGSLCCTLRHDFVVQKVSKARPK